MMTYHFFSINLSFLQRYHTLIKVKLFKNSFSLLHGSYKLINALIYKKNLVIIYFE